MEFCPECDGILLPKKGTNELYCRICKKTYKMEDINKNLKNDYKITHKTVHKVSSKTAIMEVKEKTKAISEDERKAFEDFFTVDTVDAEK